ncbi:MAG: alpha/beta hydrolase [Pseudomonadota bacterium]
MTQDRDIVLIHGAYAGPWSLDTYRGFLDARGWRCHVPALRHHDLPPGAEPDPAFAETSILDYTADIAAFAEQFETPPVLLGHAVGGLIAQKVAARGLASGVVLINPNAPWGMLPETDDERAVARAFMAQGPFWAELNHVTFDLMAPFALNKLDEATRHAVFERLGPESGRVMFEMFFWMFDDRRAIAVDYDGVTCPVLVVSGEEDRAVRHQVGAEVAKRYGARGRFHLAPGHAHFLFMEPGWEAVAQICADWLDETIVDRS